VYDLLGGWKVVGTQDVYTEASEEKQNGEITETSHKNRRR